MTAPAGLDMLAVKIAGEHIAHCRPPLPRADARQWQDYIAELVAGGHDPADVQLALRLWRDRRAAGERIGRAIADRILEDLELEAAAHAERYSILCLACLNFHVAGEACLWS